MPGSRAMGFAPVRHRPGARPSLFSRALSSARTGSAIASHLARARRLRNLAVNGFSIMSSGVGRLRAPRQMLADLDRLVQRTGNAHHEVRRRLRGIEAKRPGEHLPDRSDVARLVIDCTTSAAVYSTFASLTQSRNC